MTEMHIFLHLKKSVIIIISLMTMLFNQNRVNGQQLQKPNILFIAVDDLKPYMGCFGDSLAITPNMDAIADKGMVFTKTYCQQAVCAPSRASLLTGRYPDQTRVWDLQTLIRDENPDILTLPQYFKQNGYSSYGVGKIFDYRSVTNNDELSWNKYGNPYQNNLYDATTGKPSYFYALPAAKDTIAKLEAEAVVLGVDKNTYVKERYWPSVENANVPYNAYVDGAITLEGINLMNQLKNAGKPFFLAVGFQRPHLPFNAPKEFWDIHDRKKFSLAEFQKVAANSPSIAYHNFEELRSYTDIPKTGNIAEDKQLELIHGYYAATSYIDFLIGKLTTRLSELGLADNTIIVIWGDHGWHFGDHNLWCKHSNFEQATRSPLIISYPGQPNAGKKYTHPAEFVDIATTLCDLSGLKIPLDFEGESLVPFIKNPDLHIREGALSQYPRNQYMGYTLRTDRYRYTKWVKKSDGSHFESELYDYETDPLETINQVSNSIYSNVVHKLDSIVQNRIVNPSTQKKIEFEIHGINESNDTVRIRNAEIRFEESVNFSNPNGSAHVNHVPGVYSYSIISKGFKQENHPISITNDTLIRVFLQAELYEVSLKIMGGWNNSEIANASVFLGSMSKTTTISGEVKFNEVSFNTYEIRVELENGVSQIFKNIEIYSDTSMVLVVDEPTFDVRFLIENLYTKQSIYETRVTLTHISKLTNNEGIAVFSITEGIHNIEIVHPKYSIITDSVQIYSDTLFNYRLLPAFSTIKFKLSEGTTPVNKALVKINDDEQLSNSLGSAFFKDYSAFKTYNYHIEKDNYRTIDGNIFLVNDTTIDIQMEVKPTSVSDISVDDGFLIWPNPAVNFIYFRVPVGFSKGVAQVLDMKGNIINSFPLNKSKNHEFSVKKLPVGSYLLNIVTSEWQINKVFIKEE